MQLKKRRIILAFTIIIAICSIYGTYLPRRLITIAPEDVSYIHIFSGSTGEYIDVSDSTDIAHIITNLSSCKFKKGKFAPFQLGYGYELTIYNRKENVYKRIKLNSSNIIRYHGFFFYGGEPNIDLDYIYSLLSETDKG